MAETQRAVGTMSDDVIGDILEPGCAQTDLNGFCPQRQECDTEQAATPSKARAIVSVRLLMRRRLWRDVVDRLHVKAYQAPRNLAVPRPLVIGAFSETDVDTKKTPKQSTRLGVLSCCLNLRL